jgi:hypothetical protein
VNGEADLTGFLTISIAMEVALAGPSPAKPMSAKALAINGNERRDRRGTNAAPSRS